jgi:hypothetical protein
MPVTSLLEMSDQHCRPLTLSYTLRLPAQTINLRDMFSEQLPPEQELLSSSLLSSIY